MMQVYIIPCNGIPYDSLIIRLLQVYYFLLDFSFSHFMLSSVSAREKEQKTHVDLQALLFGLNQNMQYSNSFFFQP